MKVSELTPSFPRKLASIYNLFDKKVVIDNDKAFLVLLRIINFDCKKLFNQTGNAGNWENAFLWEERKHLARKLLDDYITKRKERENAYPENFKNEKKLSISAREN